MGNKQVFQSLLLFFLLGICLTPFIQPHQFTFCEVKSICLTRIPVVSQGKSWNNSNDPYVLTLNTYYEIPNDDLSFATFHAQTGDIYYVYLKYVPSWDAELYNDSAYQHLLGTFYSIPLPIQYPLYSGSYMIFSPAHSGWYYLLLYCDFPWGDGRIAILNATPYIVNTTRLIAISPETCPVQFLSVDLTQGNYTTLRDRLYVRIERGWGYVILPEMYGILGPAPTYLEDGTYGLIFEESCNFCLTGFCSFPRNKTNSNNPGDNNTDGRAGSSILNGITPLFGIGILVGLFVLYKFKKK